MNKQLLTKELIDIFGDEKFAGHWWIIKLPGLGNATPNEIWDRDPQEVADYIEGYKNDAN